MLVVVFATSMFLQSTAAVLSLRMMRITGWRTAWGLVTVAIVLMVLRRVISFHGFISPAELPGPPVRLAAELVALLTSILMVAGIAWLAPLFIRAKDNERALRRSERHLRSFTDALPDMTFVVDLEGRYVDVVAPDEELLAVSSSEIIGRTLSESLPESVAKPALAVVKQTAETGQSRDLSYCLDVPAGRRWFEGRTALMPGSPGEPTLVMFVVRDITDRVAAEEAYRVLAEQSIQGIAILQHGRLAYVNAAAARMLGRTMEELLDLPESGLLAIVAETERVAFEEWLEPALTGAGVSSPEEFCMIRKDGRPIWTEGLAARCEYRGEMAVQLVFVDATRRKEIEDERLRLLERLQEAQKWESLSVLAGGVAHHFNNLLQSILGFAELGEIETPARPDNEGVREYFAEIIGAAKRAAALSTQMLACSGHGPQVFETLSVSELIHEMAYALESLCPSEIELKFELTDAPAKIWADPDQVRQLVLNLFNNAIEAIGTDRGVVTIKTDLRPFSSSDAAVVVPAAHPEPGDHPCIEIRDTGCGMSPATKAHAFDPFFSTKFTGRGLGLAAVLGIVRGHHAVIMIESELSEGACVRVIFPAFRSEETAPVAHH